MAVQKLSSKNQIVIPKEARQAKGVKGGDELLVVVKDDLTLVMPKPKRYAKTLQGLTADQGYVSVGLPEASAPVVVTASSTKGLPTERERISLDTNIVMSQ